MEGALAIYNQLKTAWKAGNLESVGTLLSKIKVALTKLSFLPNCDSPPEKELLLARDAIEIGAQWSVKMGKVEEFERYINQLKAYYFDYSGALPASPYMAELLGLNLLNLLSQNRIAEFHTEVERYDLKLLNDFNVQHPVNLEQSLMEGAYNQVFESRSVVPAESFYFFMDILLDTVREEIASCIQSSFDSLAVADAVKLLRLEAEQERLNDIAANLGWVVDGGRVLFPSRTETTTSIRSDKIIKQSLEYAKELERIV